MSTSTAISVPEIIDPVFSKTSPKRSFSMTEHTRFGLVFTKTRVYKFGHWLLPARPEVEFLEEIQTEVLRVFLLAIHRHLY
jgi:hypothetical protein